MLHRSRRSLVVRPGAALVQRVVGEERVGVEVVGELVLRVVGGVVGGEVAGGEGYGCGRAAEHVGSFLGGGGEDWWVGGAGWWVE